MRIDFKRKVGLNSVLRSQRWSKPRHANNYRQTAFGAFLESPWNVFSNIETDRGAAEGDKKGPGIGGPAAGDLVCVQVQGDEESGGLLYILDVQYTFSDTM